MKMTPIEILCYEKVDLTPITTLLKASALVYTMGSFSKVLLARASYCYVVSCAEFSASFSARSASYRFAH